MDFILSYKEYYQPREDIIEDSIFFLEEGEEYYDLYQEYMLEEYNFIPEELFEELYGELFEAQWQPSRPNRYSRYSRYNQPSQINRSTQPNRYNQFSQPKKPDQPEKPDQSNKSDQPTVGQKVKKHFKKHWKKYAVGAGVAAAGIGAAAYGHKKYIDKDSKRKSPKTAAGAEKRWRSMETHDKKRYDKLMGAWADETDPKKKARLHNLLKKQGDHWDARSNRNHKRLLKKI